MNIRKSIPNILTLANGLFGSFAIYYALVPKEMETAIWWLLLAAVCDLFDGFAARSLNAVSPLGKDLDSLSDVISFGVAPAAMLSVALQHTELLHPLISFVIVPFTVYRLAKFNNDPRQGTTFYGLPCPANGIFFAGLAYWINSSFVAILGLSTSATTWLQVVLLVVILGMSILLVSEVQMFSLKEFSSPWAYVRLALLTLTLIGGCLTWSFTGLALTIALYVLLSLITPFAEKVK